MLFHLECQANGTRESSRKSCHLDGDGDDNSVHGRLDPVRYSGSGRAVQLIGGGTTGGPSARPISQIVHLLQSCDLCGHEHAGEAHSFVAFPLSLTRRTGREPMNRHHDVACPLLFYCSIGRPGSARSGARPDWTRL